MIRFLKIRIFVLVMLMNFVSYGQVSFEMIAGGDNEDNSYQILSLEDGSFTVLGKTKSYGDVNGDVIFLNVSNIGEINWTKIYGTSLRDAARHFIQTPDNGYLIGTWKLTSGLNDDWHIIKTDASGNILWEKFVGGSADDELQNLVRIENDYYLGGSTQNFGDGNASVYIAKMDGNGIFDWFKVYGSYDNDHCMGIVYGENNTIVLGNISSSFGNGSLDFMHISIDLNGNILWANNYPTMSLDFCRDLIRADDQGIISVGSSKSFGSGDNDIYLLKTNNLGKVQWAKTYGGTADDVGYNIKKLDDGNFVVCGITNSFGAGSADVFVMKIDPSGNLIWAKTYGGEEEEKYSSIDIVSEGGFVIAAATYSYGSDDGDLFFVKTDSEGNSCCNLVVDNTIVRDVIVTETPIFPSVSEGHVFPSHNVEVTSPVLDRDIICIDSLQIIGETNFCSNQLNVPYQAVPDMDGDYFWTVPENAIIIYGQGTSYITVNFGGTSGYITVSRQNLCSSDMADSIFVSLTEGVDIDLGVDTSFCYGQTILLSPGGGYYSYQWQDGSNDSLLVAGTTGYYWVQVTDSIGCVSVDSVYIETFMDFGFSLGPDTTVICYGDYIFLHGPQGYQSYGWQDGSAYLDFLADTAGIYWLEITDENNCAARDSMLLIVNVIPDDFLGADTVMCDGDFFDIHAPSYYYNYLWQDGSSDSVFIAWQTGDYWVYVEDSIGCSGVDTISLSLFQSPLLNHTNDTLICPGDSLVLSSDKGSILYYIWNTGSNDSSITILQQGDYWVEMGTYCGAYFDSITVGYYSNTSFYLGPDTSICRDESLTLSAGYGFLNYLWSDGSGDSILTVDEPGVYSVVIDDGRCILSDSVKVGECSLLWIPNVFTPNGDKINDDFYAIGEYVQQFKMVIFNRWGQTLKTLYNIDEKWDGTYNGEICSSGVYYYVAEYEEIGRNSLPERRRITGSVALISGK